MISIIIPVYRENNYLPRTLKSLTLQTAIKEAEIILAEYNPDFSYYTSDVAKEFQEKYKIPVYVKTVNKSGIAWARNEGVLASKGEYLLNFDADCRFNTKDALERMIQPLKDGSAMLTICDNEFDYRGLSKTEFKKMEIPQRALDGINYAQILGMPILEPGSCFKTEAFVEVGGFNDVLQYELSKLGPRFLLRFPGMVKRIEGVSVIVSPRRAIKFSELGLGALSYTTAIRGKQVLGV